MLLPGTFDCLEELLAAADLFVQPAACDAPPLALLTALASGSPVVAADSPALREAIEPGQNGLLFPAGDPKSLAAQMERLLASPAEGVTLGSAARDLIRSGPAPAGVVTGYLNVVSQVLSTIQRHA